MTKQFLLSETQGTKGKLQRDFEAWLHDYLIRAFAENDGSVSKTAVALGRNRQDLHKLMKRVGVVGPATQRRKSQRGLCMTPEFRRFVGTRPVSSADAPR